MDLVEILRRKCKTELPWKPIMTYPMKLPPIIPAATPKPRQYAFPWEMKNGRWIRRLFRGHNELSPIVLIYDSGRCSWTSHPDSVFYVGMQTSVEGAKSTAERRLKKMGFIFVSQRLVCML